MILALLLERFSFKYLLKGYSSDFLVNKSSKMWNTQPTQADPLIAEKDGYKVLLFVCSALDLEPQTSSES